MRWAISVSSHPMTPSALAYSLTVAAGVAWLVGVVFFFRAARSAKAGTPWKVRAQPFYLLTKPDVWTVEGRQYWKVYFLSMAVFAACIGIMFLVD
jgi:hypothetical protein